MRRTPYRGQQYCSELGGECAYRCHYFVVPRGEKVLITTCSYTKDGSRIETWWRQHYPTCPDRPWGPLSLRYNGYQVFPRGKERPGRDANPSPLLMTWSKKSRAIPVFPLKAVRPEQNLSACTRVHFTLRFTLPQRGTGTTVAQWLRCCATNRKVTGSLPADVI